MPRTETREAAPFRATASTRELAIGTAMGQVRGQAANRARSIAGAEAEAGEGLVVHPVQTPARVGEIPVLQARIQAPGEADHLGHAVTPRAAAVST